MPAVVWGTRVKEELGGACAHLCAGCGEVTVADEFIVSEAQHIYFIHGVYKEAQRYVCCRLCGIASKLPPGCKVAPADSLVTFIPSEEFIAATNPRLAQDCTPESVGTEFPHGVSRIQWAVLNTINSALARQNDDDKVTGFTGGLALIAMLGVVFSMVKVWDWSNENGAVTAGVLLCVAVVVFGAICILHSFLVNRAVTKQVRAYVLNCLRHTGSSVRDLADAAMTLGRNFRKASRHLKKCAGSYANDG